MNLSTASRRESVDANWNCALAQEGSIGDFASGSSRKQILASAHILYRLLKREKSGVRKSPTNGSDKPRMTLISRTIKIIYVTGQIMKSGSSPAKHPPRSPPATVAPATRTGRL